MGLTIANDVRKQKQHKEAYTDPARQQAKETLQQIAYSELRNNKTLEDFLYGLERKGVDIDPVKNKQDKIYGIRFSYEGHTFKASEIGWEFGFHSIIKNFSPSLEENHSQQVQQSYSQHTNNQQSNFGAISGIASLLVDLSAQNGQNVTGGENNTLKRKKKKQYYGRQF